MNKKNFQTENAVRTSSRNRKKCRKDSNQIDELEGVKLNSKNEKRKKGRTLKYPLRAKECTYCNKTLSDSRNLNRHLKLMHDITLNTKEPKLNCSYSDKCTDVFLTHDFLRDHLMSTHNFKVEMDLHKFDSFEQFDQWKTEEEKNTYSCYVSSTGGKKRGDKMVYYLKCHRSGQIRAHIRNRTGSRKRALSEKGYTQIGKTCPSIMRITTNKDKSVEVMYFKTHLGHKCDEESLKYIRLNTEERKFIVGKLAEGKPVSEVIKHVKETSPKNSKVSKLNVIHKRDVYNVSYKMSQMNYKFENSKHAFIEWIKKSKLHEMEDSPISYFENNEENELILIIIHPLQKIIYSLYFEDIIIYVKTVDTYRKYNSKLTTVFLIDQNGISFPIAYMLSYKLNKKIVKNFFNVLSSHLGSINAMVFVSDNLKLHYNAWKQTMAEAKEVFLCNLNLLSEWENELNSIGDVGTREEIYKRLQYLLEEKEKPNFDIMLSSLLSYMINSNESLEFCDYFIQNFGDNTKYWSNYNRKNFNLYLKPLSDAIEDIYMKYNLKHTIGLEELFLYIRDTCFTHLFDLDAELKTQVICQLVKNHEESKMMAKETICKANGMWVISESGCEHVIQQVTCVEDCTLKCQKCKICIHSYTCSCLNYMYYFNMCKHIHAIASRRLEVKEEALSDTEIEYLRDDFMDCEDGEDTFVMDSSVLKQSAISSAKDMVHYLEESKLSNEKYVEIILAVNQIMRKNSSEDS